MVLNETNFIEALQLRKAKTKPESLFQKSRVASRCDILS